MTAITSIVYKSKESLRLVWLSPLGMLKPSYNNKKTFILQILHERDPDLQTTTFTISCTDVNTGFEITIKLHTK